MVSSAHVSALTPPSDSVDITDTHVAVSILSHSPSDTSLSSPSSDDLLGSVLLPLSELRSQRPLTVWYPLQSPEVDGAGVQQSGALLQLSLQWLHSLDQLAASMQNRSASDLQTMFAGVELSQLLLHVHSAELTLPVSPPTSPRASIVEGQGEGQWHWQPPHVSLFFQGIDARTPPARTVARAANASSRLFSHSTILQFDSRCSFSVDSDGDMQLQTSLRRVHQQSAAAAAAAADSSAPVPLPRSLSSTSDAAEQLLAVSSPLHCAAYRDQKTRRITLPLMHFRTGQRRTGKKRTDEKRSNVNGCPPHFFLPPHAAPFCRFIVLRRSVGKRVCVAAVAALSPGVHQPT
jgi:hypothetical protein